MTTSFIAMGLAFLAVVGLVVGIGGLSLLVGAVDYLFGGPKINFLKSEKGDHGFAFSFNWSSAKEPASMDYINIRLYDAFGESKNKQVIASTEYEPKKHKFAQDVDLGFNLKEIMDGAKGDKTLVEIEVGSRKEGVHFQFSMNGTKFLEKIQLGVESVDEFNARTGWGESKPAKSPINVPTVNYIADTVPGKGNQIALPTNPAFAELFAGSASGAASADSGAGAENYGLAKVWIEPGCIVCNACEDIYPEVFEVTEDSCLIRPGAPLDDGLRVEEAAEACPVEVIKFTKAG